MGTPEHGDVQHSETTDARSAARLDSIAPPLGGVAAMLCVLGVVFDTRWLVLAIGIGGLAGADWIVTTYVDTLDGTEDRRQIRRLMLRPATIVLVAIAATTLVVPVVWSIVDGVEMLGKILIALGCAATAVTVARDLLRQHHLGPSSQRLLGAFVPAVAAAFVVL